MPVTLDRREIVKHPVALAAVAALPRDARACAGTPDPAAWTTLPTEAYAGKQDDIAFVSRTQGWYGNGKGRIYATTDGGDSWTKLLDQPGTFIRALGFVDARVGVLGNIGPGSFPGVTDTVPLYRTEDGGRA